MSDSSKYNKLLLWARSNGATIPDTLLLLSEPHGHIRTTVPIEPGTPLFHVPHALFITSDVAAKALPQLKGCSVHARMCAFIALERHKDGFWRDYLDSLPTTFTTPGYFTPQEFEALEGTNLGSAWNQRKYEWEEELEYINNHFPGLNWEDYLWAATILSSRSFPSHLLDTISNNPAAIDISTDATLSHPQKTDRRRDDVDASQPILVPILDLLNHKPNHPVTWLTGERKITFTAETTYAAGDEIFNNYGPKANEELLMGYGFCIPDNPHDCVALKLPGNETSIHFITQSDLAPKALVEEFRNSGDHTWRERFTGQSKARGREYDGYALLLHALAYKMSPLGRELRYEDTEAGKYSRIYRTGQKKLYRAAYNHIFNQLDLVTKAGAMISMNALLRGDGERVKKPKLNEVDQFHDNKIIAWLCRHLHNKNIGADGVSEEGKRYITNLIESFYRRIDWFGLDGIIGEDDDYSDLSLVQEEMANSGLETSMEEVRMICEFLRAETTFLKEFPDVEEIFSTARETEPAHPLRLPPKKIDEVIFIEELNESIIEYWDKKIIKEWMDRNPYWDF